MTEYVTAQNIACISSVTIEIRQSMNSKFLQIWNETEGNLIFFTSFSNYGWISTHKPETNKPLSNKFTKKINPERRFLYINNLWHLQAKKIIKIVYQWNADQLVQDQLCLYNVQPAATYTLQLEFISKR